MTGSHALLILPFNVVTNAATDGLTNRSQGNLVFPCRASGGLTAQSNGCLGLTVWDGYDAVSIGFT